ncbi:DMT family transporter [Nonomuraea wenchangensis]
MNVLLYAAMTTIWGASFFFTAIALDGFSPYMIVLIRTALAAAVLAVFLRTRRRRLPSSRRELLHLLVLGAFNIALPFTLLTAAQEHVSSSTTVVLSATTPVFVFLMAVLAARTERFDALRLGGMVVAFAGIGLLSGPGQADGEGNWQWQLVVVTSSMIFACGNVYTKRFLSQLAPSVIACGQFAAGALVLLPVTAATGHLTVDRPGPLPILALLELGLLGSAAGYLLYFRFIMLWGSTAASVNTYFQPIVGLLLGVLVLGERMAGAQWAALGVTLLGLLLFGYATVRASRAGPGRPAAVRDRPVPARLP